MDIHFINLKDVEYDLKLDVRNWRNSPEVAKYFQIAYIDEKMHREWLKTLEEDIPNNIAFIIIFSGKMVGMTYFMNINYKIRSSDWGIYLRSSENRGLGIGKSVIDWSIKYAKNLGIKELFLEVIKDNLNAISLYESKGFKKINFKNSNVIRYKKDLYESSN